MFSRMLNATKISGAVLALITHQSIAAQDQCEVDLLQSMTVHSVAAAITKYKTASLKKDEFETTAAYQARVAAARDGLPHGPILISIPQASLTTFDADAGLITVSPYALSSTCLVNEYGLAEEMKAVKFGRTGRYGGSAYCLSQAVGSEGGETYEATNGFGAKVSVEKSRLKMQGIYFGMGDFGQSLVAGRKEFSKDPLYSFGASVEEAKSLKQNAELAVLVNPSAPFTGSGTYYRKPTFQSPTETIVLSDFLVGSPVCVAVRDSKTGKIFAVSRATN